MAKKSKYPKGDIRSQYWEHKIEWFDWDLCYKTLSSLAILVKDCEKQDKKGKTSQYIKRASLKPLIRFTTELLGEKYDYYISNKAYNAAEYDPTTNLRKLDWRTTGPHYCEHLIPVGQLADELIKNPDIKNVKALFEKQKLVIVLRTEQAKYEGKNSLYGKEFKSYRSDADIKKFYMDHNIKPLKKFEAEDKKRK